MWSNIYPLVRVVGSIKCQIKRCHICYNVREADCFQSYHLDIECKINHKFLCNNKCLVYLLICKISCTQYVEQTVNIFRLLWNNYKENNRIDAKGSEHKLAYFFGRTNCSNVSIICFISCVCYTRAY